MQKSMQKLETTLESRKGIQRLEESFWKAVGKYRESNGNIPRM